MDSPELLVEDFSPRSGTSSRHSRGRTARQRRVALACQRCKRRKQRCDGAHPKCLSCSKTRNECVYITPQPPGVDHRREHIKALEDRVAELETSLAFYGASDVGDDHFRIARLMPPHENEGDDGNEMFIAIRDLSLAASGHYVGATSNIAIGRVLNSVVQSQQPTSGTVLSNVSGVDDPSPKSMNDARLEHMVNLSYMDSHTADRLIQGWHRHIATRYPIIHTPRVSYLHAHRAGLTEPYDKCILNLIYAVSGRWLESAGETGYFFSDKHYDIAYQEMDSTLRLRDSRSLDYLLLMTLYCTRAPKDPGAWTYIGLAVRLCIEMGLHRSRREKSPTIQSELDKRRFWTAYFLERDICIAIGRPPSISDHDIDVELPFDVDESVNDSEMLRQMCLGGAGTTSHVGRTASNLTPFIHRTRLKRIESEIQHTVYRVDQLGRVPESVITDFLSRLEQWRSEIPQEANSYAPHLTVPYDGPEFYTIHYHRCVRFLLYPRLTTPSPNMHYLRLCAQACTGVISDYRRLHQVFPVGFSALSIQSVFLAGLTLIYCAWLAPLGFLAAEPALADCQLLLYVIAERYPSAKKYRDIFERLRVAIGVLMQAGKHQPGHPVALDEGMQQELFAGLEETWPYGMSSDFTDIINTMTGQGGANDNLFGESFEASHTSLSIPSAGMNEVWLRPSGTGP